MGKAGSVQYGVFSVRKRWVLREKPRGPQVSATGTPSPDVDSVSMRKNSGVRFSGRHTEYLEILVDGNPVNCLLDKGSVVTLQELPKKPIT